MVSRENQLAGFYIMATLAFDELNTIYWILDSVMATISAWSN